MVETKVGHWAGKKLGRKAPSDQSKVKKLAKYLNTSALPPIPTELERFTSIGNTDWTMMGNDEYGDCTCAAVGHAIMAWTTVNGSPNILPESTILSLYTAVTAKECGCPGFNQANDTNDNGCVITDVMNDWQANGVAGDKIDLYVSVNVANHGEVRNATYLFGILNIGLLLPLTAQDQPSIWDVTGPLTGNAAPGSWGGHDVIIVGYDEKYLSLITWGERIKMTWAFWDAYVDEAYAALSPDWFSTSSPHHIAPNGLNLAQLKTDLNLV